MWIYYLLNCRGALLVKLFLMLFIINRTALCVECKIAYLCHALVFHKYSKTPIQYFLLSERMLYAYTSQCKCYDRKVDSDCTDRTNFSLKIYCIKIGINLCNNISN